MNHSMRVYLAVPYEEKDKAKALGAKWDPRHRCWYATEGSELAPFERWLPKWTLEPGDTIHLPVLLLPATCYGCRRTITCVVGLRLPEDCDVEPSGVVENVAYLSVEDCGDVLDLLLEPSARATLSIGPLLFRRTRVRPDGYVANTCFHCGTTQGAFPLYEELIDFIGGDPSRIPLLWSDGLVVDYPLAALHERGTASEETGVGRTSPERSGALGEADHPARGEGDRDETHGAERSHPAGAAVGNDEDADMATRAQLSRPRRSR